MNHCIQGGVGDGDGSEDDEGAVRGAGQRRRGELLPYRRHHGERRPLAPFLHGLLGALPHGDGIHGGGKNVAFGGCNSWVEESPRVRFPPFI
jgi:hypothetical protein